MLDELEQLISLYQQTLSSISGLWNFYIVVALGVIGFVASGKHLAARGILRGVLMVGFIVFAASNLYALWDAYARLNAIAVTIKEFALPSGDARLIFLCEHFRPRPIELLVIFHAVMDTFAVSAIWIMAKLRGGNAENLTN